MAHPLLNRTDMRAALALAVLAACTVHVDDESPCVENTNGEPVMLVDPATQQCVEFAPDACDARCGPCPAGAAVLPTWGKCTSACRDLDEKSCSRAPACRVARDFAGYYTNGVSFAGCWPLDTAPASSPTCTGLDAEGCSRNADCTGLYSNGQFTECASEAQHVGACFGKLTCDAIAPPCGADRIPGIENGCYTGACIPREFCPVATP